MTSLPRLVLEHRRLLAAVCAGLAVAAGLGAVRADGDVVEVTVAARDLVSGQPLVAADVERVATTADAVPAGALDQDAVVGLRVGGPMRRGEPFTDARVLRPGALADAPEGSVLATVRLGDPAAAQGVRVGDRVDVVSVAADGAGSGPRADVVAEDLQVAALPIDGDEAPGLVVLAPRETALRLAAVALEARLGVVTTSTPD